MPPPIHTRLQFSRVPRGPTHAVGYGHIISQPVYGGAGTLGRSPWDGLAADLEACGREVQAQAGLRSGKALGCVIA